VTKASQDNAAPADPHVARLAGLFESHPAWLEAARRIRRGASSRVFFSHRPGEAWHLLRTDQGSRLVPGPGEDPDFAFRFSPGAIDRLSAVKGGAAEFAAELFERVVSPDATTRVDLRVVAPFRRLVARGYLGLLMTVAPRLASMRARLGLKTLGDLRRLVEARRRASLETWEHVEKPAEVGDSEA
jgi:hypothetical protein